MKTYQFVDPNSSLVIIVSDETEEGARQQIDEINSENLSLEHEEEEEE